MTAPYRDNYEAVIQRLVAALQNVAPEDLERVMEEAKNRFLAQSRQSSPLVFTSQNLFAESIFENWRPLFKEYFGLTPDFSKIVIPQLTPETQDHARAILMPEELARNANRGFINWIFNVYRELKIPVWSYYDDLDKEVPHNGSVADRHPKDGSYAICVRDRIEADEELKNLSAEQIWQMNIITETLPERLVHGLKVYYESKQHLDIMKRTLCAGSRSSCGGVPSVYWCGDELGVYDDDPDSHSGYLRTRAAVS